MSRRDDEKLALLVGAWLVVQHVIVPALARRAAADFFSRLRGGN